MASLSVKSTCFNCIFNQIQTATSIRNLEKYVVLCLTKTECRYCIHLFYFENTITIFREAQTSKGVLCVCQNNFKDMVIQMLSSLKRQCSHISTWDA